MRHHGPAVAPTSPLDDLVRRCADPGRADAVLDRLGAARPEALARTRRDPALGRRVVDVAAASGWLGRLLVADPLALDVLAAPDEAVPVAPTDPRTLARWRHLEHLRIAADDLGGRDPLERTMARITAMGATVLDRALGLAGADDLAVVGMGKAGGTELNYASDVDVVLVGPGAGEAAQRAARRFLDVARTALRVDVDLRPEGRDGPLVRTLDGYASHWERAEPWERQALLKARPLAGDPSLGTAFAEAAGGQLWERGFGADAIHQVRAMKARTERHAAAGIAGDRDIKRTAGGLRDIEFSVQLLQLVHGPLDPGLRVRGTLPALTALADGGYVGGDDALWLRASYRFLRRLEHAVQLDEDRQTHAVPAGRPERARLARVLGLHDRPRTAAVDELDAELTACRATVRRIHEQVYFRPLLDAFAGVDAPLGAEAAATRLAAFGFADATRTRQAVGELTRGLTRASRLMAQTLPLLLDWLSVGPDPDRGLLALRTLVASDAPAVAAACRDSPEAARRLCLVAATSPTLTRSLGRAPELLRALGEHLEPTGTAARGRLVRSATSRPDVASGRVALAHVVRQEQARVGVADVLDEADPDAVGRALADVARGAVEAAVALARPKVPFAVLALGRLAGGSLGYASDLDLLLAHGATTDAGREEAARAVEEVRRVLLGSGPADRLFEVDLDLRPGGRSAPLVQGRHGIEEHVERWAEPWKRLALSRLEPLAGDLDLARDVVEAVGSTVWRPLTEDDRRAVRRIKARAERERIPAGEDPAFHLKLGPGALADVELTVALLLLDLGRREPGTVAGIEVLRAAGRLDDEEAEALAAAHASCDRARNRWSLVAGRPRNALPAGEDLATLARSLGTTGPELRDEYLRLTRRARRVVVRRFYGQDA